MMKLLQTVLTLFALLGLNCVAAQPLEKVKQDIVNEVKQAQTRLSNLEAQIARESASLGQQINDKQNQVRSLREQAAVKTRLIDDQTLALSEIESRLAKWQQQDNYQKRLLMDLASRSTSLANSAEVLEALGQSLNAGIPLLNQWLEKQSAQLTPRWQQNDVLMPDGQYQSAQTLSIGPNHWFLLPQTQQSGLLNQDKEVLIFFDEEQTQQLDILFSQLQASITIDPSLGAAIKLEQRQETPLQHLQRGGIWAIPIVLFGLFALLIGTAKAIQVMRLPKSDPLLAERIEMLQSDKSAWQRLEKIKLTLKGAQQDIVAIALNTQRGEQRDNKLLAYLLDYRQKLQSSLGAIAITASVAPLLGLLGTVSGMIETFNMMNLFGSGDPSVVSGGISKALITTELGLIVAIPALVMHALLNRAIRNHHTQLDSTAIRLGELGAKQP